MAKSANPFHYFDSSPEVIRLVVMMYVKYSLSLRNVVDLLAERAINICHVKINGKIHYLWRAVGHEGEVLESFASKARDKPPSQPLQPGTPSRQPITYKAHAQPPWLSGSPSWPWLPSLLPHLRQLETSRRWTDSTLGRIIPMMTIPSVRS